MNKCVNVNAHTSVGTQMRNLHRTWRCTAYCPGPPKSNNLRYCSFVLFRSNALYYYMKIRLKPLKGLIRPVRRFGALGSAPTQRVENTVPSALCLQNASKTPYYRLCVYTTLRKHRAVGSVPTIRLGCTVRNHNSKSRF